MWGVSGCAVHGAACDHGQRICAGVSGDEEMARIASLSGVTISPEHLRPRPGHAHRVRVWPVRLHRRPNAAGCPVYQKIGGMKQRGAAGRVSVT